MGHLQFIDTLEDKEVIMEILCPDSEQQRETIKLCTQKQEDSMQKTQIGRLIIDQLEKWLIKGFTNNFKKD